jgi:hypothetical protein
MTRIGFRLLFVVLMFIVIAIAPQHAAAQCLSGYANGFSAPSDLNNEGHTERPADIKITSGVANCFSSGNVISVTYNGILTVPTTLTNLSTTNIVITNPLSATDGALVLEVVTTSGISSSGPQTVIQMTVLGATTDPGAAITLQNLRFDVTGLAGTVAAAATMNSFVSGSGAGLTAVATKAVGSVIPTVNTALSHVTPGAGLQSAGGPLVTQAIATFGTPAIWAVSPFRVAIPTPAYPVGCGPAPLVACTDTVDIPTTATSLVIDIENIPSGVTVTLPSTLSIWPAVGAATPSFKWNLRTSVSSAGIVQGIYDTVIATGTSFATFPIDTGAAAMDSTAGAVGPPAVAATPVTIGVQIGTSSGSGTAKIRVVFGPGLAAAFTGDDANAAKIPVYTAGISTAGVGREIITDSVIFPATGVDTAPTAFFVIAPTQSVLLYPYVTDLDGYLTGLAAANTGNDSTIFGTKGQTGPITFWFFPSNGTPFSYTATVADGVGLNAAGNLAPGSVFAASLDIMLGHANQSALVGNFSGYVIAVCQFNYGHGFSIVFNPAAIGTATNALVLGSGARVGGSPEALNN